MRKRSKLVRNGAACRSKDLSVRRKFVLRKKRINKGDQVKSLAVFRKFVLRILVRWEKDFSAWEGD